MQVYAHQLPPTKFVTFANVLLCWAKADVAADAKEVPVVVNCRANDLETYDPDVGDFVTMTGNYSFAAALDSGASLAGTKAVAQAALQGSYSWTPPWLRGEVRTRS